jgi:localization factor PodJL
MADSSLPWSIKGISANARAAAREAAKRAGMPLGEWLTRAIGEVAAAEARDHGEAEPPPKA